MTTNASGIFIGSNLYKPESLCLDFAAKRLYWVDNGIGNQGVYSVNIETGAATDFKKHITLSNYMVDITLLKDLAFVSSTTPTGSELISFSKDSGANKITMSFTTDSIGDVTVYDEYIQPAAQNPCRENNGGCDHICIPSGDNSVCLCNLRYILNEGGKTCKVDIPMENFLLVADGGAERIYQVGLDNEYVDPLPMPDELSTPTSVTFDHVTRYIYYTNLDQHRVNRIHITDPFNIQSIRVFGDSYLEGIAIDSAEQKIYVVDSTVQIVYRMDPDGGNLQDIVDNTDNPRALVLWTEKRLLYWSDWGTHKKIERASMDDGSNRTVIIESDLSGPNGLAIDFSELKLYWTDNGFDNVERSDLDGGNREVIAQIDSKLFGITFYEQYLYVTDRDSRSIFKINKNNGSYSVLVSGVFNIPYGIFMVTESVQKSTFSATQSSLLSTVESTLNQSGAVFAISPTKDSGKQDLRVIIGASIGTVLFVLLVAAGIGIGCYCKRKNESSSPGTTVGYNGSGNEPNRDSDRINGITIDINGIRPADRDASNSLNRLKDGFLDAPGIFLAIDQKVCHFNITAIRIPTPGDVWCRYSGQAGSRLKVDFANKDFYLSRNGTKILIRHNFQIDGTSTALYRPKTIHGIDALSFDWIGHNIYWVESTAGLLGVANRVDYRTYIKTSMDNPKGVAVDPEKGVVYWSDGVPSISRIDLKTNATDVLVNTDISSPGSLCLDFPAKRLYWIDNLIQGVHSVDISTGLATDDMQHITLSNHMIDIAIYRDFAFVSTNEKSELISFLKFSGEGKTFFSFTQDNVGDVTIYDTYNQPELPNPCEKDNGGCDHICIPSNANVVCLCNQRYVLHEDGRTCRVDIPMEYFLLVAEGGDQLYQVGLDNEYADPLPMPDELGTPIEVTYDPVTQYVYYTNLDQHRVHRIHITDPFNIHSVRVFSDGVMEGIAVDSLEQKIYVVHSTDRIIFRMNADGGNLERIIDNTDKPRALALWPRERLLFWTDWGTPKKIERASMDDGSNRTVIIGTGLSGPNGLTIDFEEQKLYWTDSGYDKIERSDLDGSNRELVAQIDSRFFGIACYGDSVYVTDTDSRSIYKINKNNGSYTTIAAGVFEIPYGIFMVTEPLKTSTSTSSSTSPSASTISSGSHTMEPVMNQTAIETTIEYTLAPATNATSKEDLFIIIGASVGTVFAVLIILTGILIYCWCKRRNPSTPPPDTVSRHGELTTAVVYTGSGNDPNRDSNFVNEIKQGGLNEITLNNFNDVRPKDFNDIRPTVIDGIRQTDTDEMITNGQSDSNELAPNVQGSAEPLSD